MSDDPTETVEETVEEPAPAQEPVAEDPGEDVGALKRAYQRVKDERQQAKEELRRIREDEDARAALLKEWGYEVADDEADTSEEDLFEDDDPTAPLKKDLDEIKEWRAQQEQERERAAITADIVAINEGSDWELDDHDRAVIEAWARSSASGKQFTRANLEQSHVAL